MPMLTFEAESVAYAVCAYYGIKTDENSFGYVASWSKDKTLPELQESLTIINETVSELIESIDRHYAEIVDERYAELASSELTGTVERLFTVDDRYLHVQRTDDGVDYTIYEQESGKLMDGGQLDADFPTLAEAAKEICALHSLGGSKLIQAADIAAFEQLCA